MRHSRLAAVVISGLLLAAVGVQAQEKGPADHKALPKQMDVPRPAPEVSRLDYFNGHWRSEGEMKPSPWGPGGKVSGDSRCSWMSGRYFVVCRDDGTSPMGRVQGLGVMGYDAAAKNYTYNGFNSIGENVHATGTVAGKTWTYTNENVVNGKKMKGRYTITEDTETSYNFKLETSEDGKTWTSMMEGKVTKAAHPERTQPDKKS